MPYPIDSAILRKATADWQAIIEAGFEHRFHAELSRRLFDADVRQHLHGHPIPPHSVTWADSFASKLADILDAPIHQVEGAAVELLPVTKRKVAMELLSEMATHARVRNAANKPNYPRRAG